MNNNQKSRLYLRIMQSFICIGLLPVLLFGGYTLVFTKLIARSNFSGHLAACVEESISSFELLIKYNISLAEGFGTDEVASLLGHKELTEQEQRLLYRQIYALNSNQEENPIVCVTDTKGVPVAAIGIFSDDLDKWSSYHESLLSMIGNNGNKSYYSPCYYSISNGTVVTISIVSEIRVNNILYGYIYIDLPKNVLQQTLQQAGSLQTDHGSVTISYMVYTKHNYVIYNDYFSNYSNGTNILDLDFRDSFKTKTPTTLFYKYKGAELLIEGMQDTDGAFIVLGSVPIGLVVENNNYILLAVMFLCLASVIICGIFATRLTRSFTMPIYQILSVMHQVEQGDLSARVCINRNDEIGALADGFNTMIGKVDSLFQCDIEKQHRLFLAEFYNLQSQIRPHFLYNVLDSIKWLAKLGSMEEVSEIATRLGEILKRCVDTSGEMETIQQGVSFVKSYLAIQQIIYPDKLSVTIEVDSQILSEQIPRFLLQPIVENSVLHGIEPKIGFGTLSFWVGTQDGTIVFIVSDDGVGIEEDKQAALLFPGKGDHGNGLYNVDRRIKLHYGNEYGLKIESRVGYGTTVTVTIPFRHERGALSC